MLNAIGEAQSRLLQGPGHVLRFVLYVVGFAGQNRGMKALPSILTLIAFLASNVAASPSGQNRTLENINAISTRVLQRSISPKFYKSLLVSPIEGWIVVRANLSGSHLVGVRVVHSELNGAYDALARKLANEALITGYYSIDRRTRPSVVLNVLIYRIADGTMALSFPTFEEPGGDQMDYWGCARLAVQKSDGSWTEIKGPETLEGKGWAVRAAGMANEIRTVRKLERGLIGLTW